MNRTNRGLAKNDDDADDNADDDEDDLKGQGEQIINKL